MTNSSSKSKPTVISGKDAVGKALSRLNDSINVQTVDVMLLSSNISNPVVRDVLVNMLNKSK